MSVKDTLEQIVNSMLYPLKAINDNFATLATPFKTIDAENKTVELEEGWTLSADNLAVNGTGFSNVGNGGVTLNANAGGLSANYRTSGRWVTIIFAGNTNGSQPSWGTSTKIGELPAGLPTPFGLVAARGILLDVTGGSNFASIQVNSDREILLNANANTSGNTDYWEGEISYQF